MNKNKLAYLKDKLQGWPDAMALTSKDVADLIGLIESSGGRGGGHPLSAYDSQLRPAPSPGPSAPLPKEVEEAMFRMEMFANCHGSKDEVADAAVLKAALSKQGPTSKDKIKCPHCQGSGDAAVYTGISETCETCKGTGEVDGPLEGQRLPCPGPKHRPAPTSGEREEMLAFVDRLIWSFEKQGLKEVIVGVGYYPALNKLRALILAPPGTVTREELKKALKQFLVKDDPVGRWQSKTTVSGIFPYLLTLDDAIDALREKGIEVGEKP